MSALIVYIWREGDAEIGHASMRLTDGTYISWYPTKRGKSTSLAANNVTLEDDIKNQQNVHPVVHLMESGVFCERRINEWSRLFKKENKEWIHLERNGPLVVFEALYAGNDKMGNLRKYMKQQRGLNTLTAIHLEMALVELLGQDTKCYRKQSQYTQSNRKQSHRKQSQDTKSNRTQSLSSVSPRTTVAEQVSK